jgi:hypothetical protein
LWGWIRHHQLNNYRHHLDVLFLKSLHKVFVVHLWHCATVNSLIHRMEASDDPSTSLVMCVGLVCIDNVLTLPRFPEEDSDQPCHNHRRSRGGNASNNCTVLAELGVESPEFLGNLPTQPNHDFRFVMDDFQLNKVLILNLSGHNT